jgi:predicted nucleic acid-binding protein
MILVDTSAWIEFLRGTGSRVDLRLGELIETGANLAISGISLMEVLACSRGEQSTRQIQRLLAGARYLPVQEPEDFEAAAAIVRAARSAGSPVRGQLDCLNAAIAIRSRTPILHRDRDYERIAAISPLEIVELEPS